MPYHSLDVGIIIEKLENFHLKWKDTNSVGNNQMNLKIQNEVEPNALDNNQVPLK